VVEAEKQERMNELGIVPEHEKVSNEKTVEQRKSLLLQRLKLATPNQTEQEGEDENEEII
jgi:hypothetical protein